MTVTNFSELDLDERLIDALRDKGYERPTAIQLRRSRRLWMGVTY